MCLVGVVVACACSEVDLFDCCIVFAFVLCFDFYLMCFG